jgi:microcystin-dependent protein
VPGDVNPADPAAKWTKLSFTTIDELTNVQVDTPNIADGQILRYSLLDAKWKNVKLNLGDLDKVSANVIDPDVHGAVLQWDDNVNQWVSSDTIQIGAIRFDDVGVGPEITGFADTDFSVTNPSEESSYVPSVYAVKQYISAQPKPFLYELDDCGDLSTATNGQVPSWDATNSKWVPYTVSTALSALTDVDLTTAPPANTQVLKFNGTTSKWEPGLAVSSLVGLTDVTLTGLADLDTLRYDNATAKWVNRPNDAYTKAEVDLKINAVATGMAHEAAVQTVTATPPASPTADLFFIVATGATGAFAGHVNEIAYWNGTAWQFATPANGETRLVEDQQNLLHWNGTAWVAVASTAASTGSSAKRGVGEIIPWVGLTVPTDYLPCDGRVVATASYPDLFAVIGNRFKGSSTSDGTTTFTLPDLRGYFLRGIGGTGGAGSIGDVQQDTTRLPRTAFTGIANTAGVHTHTNACGAYMRSDGSPNWNSGRENDGRTSADGDHTHSVTINGGGDSETRPVNIGVQWIIRVSAINGGAKGDKGDKGDSNVTDAMIGDVKESVLTEPQFKSLLSTADQLKWVLADGRDVTGSRYATVTGRNTVPDLRGAYLRMAGQNASNTSWNGGNLNSFQEDNTARPRNSQFTGTTNNNGAHSHTYTDPRRPGRNGGFSGSSWDGYPETARYPGDNTGSTSSDGDHSHTVTITGGGDVETRPKTFTVNYFIKVN